MTLFLVEKNTKKSFDEKIAKLAVKTQQNINAARNSFTGFFTGYYDGRSDNDIFAELKTLKRNEQTQAIKDVLQSWIDWQYQNDYLFCHCGVRKEK